MVRWIREMGERLADAEAEADTTPLAPLRALTAQLLLVTAAQSALEALGRRSANAPEPEPPLDYTVRRPGTGPAEVWGPALIGPLAAAAHLTRMTRSDDAVEGATRVLDTAAVVLGIGAAVTAILRGDGGRASAGPLGLASAGLLGLLLDRQERSVVEERRRLARRAAVVDRLVPRRRQKLDRIVVHV